jgi:undecaprenyl diphosphate synthase
MDRPKFRRLPRHVGIIPDGNRRWSVNQGLPKEAGYEKGLDPGLRLYEICLDQLVPIVEKLRDISPYGETG